MRTGRSVTGFFILLASSLQQRLLVCTAGPGRQAPSPGAQPGGSVSLPGAGWPAAPSRSILSQAGLGGCPHRILEDQVHQPLPCTEGSRPSEHRCRPRAREGGAATPHPGPRVSGAPRVLDAEGHGHSPGPARSLSQERPTPRRDAGQPALPHPPVLLSTPLTLSGLGTPHLVSSESRG